MGIWEDLTVKLSAVRNVFFVCGVLVVIQVLVIGAPRFSSTIGTTSNEAPRSYRLVEFPSPEEYGLTYYSNVSGGANILGVLASNGEFAVVNRDTGAVVPFYLDSSWQRLDSIVMSQNGEYAAQVYENLNNQGNIESLIYADGLTSVPEDIQRYGAGFLDVNDFGIFAGSSSFVGPNGPSLGEPAIYDATTDQLIELQNPLPLPSSGEAVSVNNLGHVLGAVYHFDAETPYDPIEKAFVIWRSPSEVSVVHSLEPILYQASPRDLSDGGLIIVDDAIGLRPTHVASETQLVPLTDILPQGWTATSMSGFSPDGKALIGADYGTEMTALFLVEGDIGHFEVTNLSDQISNIDGVRHIESGTIFDNGSIIVNFMPLEDGLVYYRLGYLAHEASCLRGNCGDPIGLQPLN
jgi:hypothetical protein